MKAADVVGRGEVPDEDHVLSRRRLGLRFAGAEDDPALCRTGRGRYATGQLFGAVRRIKRRVQECPQRIRIDPSQGPAPSFDPADSPEELARAYRRLRVRQRARIVFSADEAVRRGPPTERT